MKRYSPVSRCHGGLKRLGYRSWHLPDFVEWVVFVWLGHSGAVKVYNLGSVGYWTLRVDFCLSCIFQGFCWESELMLMRCFDGSGVVGGSWVVELCVCCVVRVGTGWCGIWVRIYATGFCDFEAVVRILGSSIGSSRFVSNM